MISMAFGWSILKNIYSNIETVAIGTTEKNVPKINADFSLVAFLRIPKVMKCSLLNTIVIKSTVKQRKREYILQAL